MKVWTHPTPRTGVLANVLKAELGIPEPRFLAMSVREELARGDAGRAAVLIARATRLGIDAAVAAIERLPKAIEAYRAVMANAANTKHCSRCFTPIAEGETYVTHNNDEPVYRGGFDYSTGNVTDPGLAGFARRPLTYTHSDLQVCGRAQVGRELPHLSAEQLTNVKILERSDGGYVVRFELPKSDEPIGFFIEEGSSWK